MSITARIDNVVHVREKWLRENAAKVKAGNAALALSLKKG